MNKNSLYAIALVSLIVFGASGCSKIGSADDKNDNQNLIEVVNEDGSTWAYKNTEIILEDGSVDGAIVEDENLETEDTGELETNTTEDIEDIADNINSFEELSDMLDKPDDYMNKIVKYKGILGTDNGKHIIKVYNTDETSYIQLEYRMFDESLGYLPDDIDVTIKGKFNTYNGDDQVNYIIEDAIIS